jgi:hypothetical protein
MTENPEVQDVSEVAADEVGEDTTAKDVLKPVPKDKDDGVQEETQETEKTEAEAEEETLKPLAAELVNAGIRGRKVIKIDESEIESAEGPFFMKEWSVKTARELVNQVKTIVAALSDRRVLDSGNSEDPPSMADRLEGILEVVYEHYDDVIDVICGTTFEDSKCKEPISKDVLQEMSIGDMIPLLRGVWHVNFNLGSLAVQLKKVGINFG